jgi:hypothetical protein
MRAQGGTRTGLQPLQTLGSPGNVRNPAGSDLRTGQSEGQSVHNVHTPVCPLTCPIQPSSSLIQNLSRAFSPLALPRAAGSLRQRHPRMATALRQHEEEPAEARTTNIRYRQLKSGTRSSCERTPVPRRIRRFPSSDALLLDAKTRNSSGLCWWIRMCRGAGFSRVRWAAWRAQMWPVGHRKGFQDPSTHPFPLFQMLGREEIIGKQITDTSPPFYAERW